jgi:hypothetical protein
LCVEANHGVGFAFASPRRSGVVRSDELAHPREIFQRFRRVFNSGFQLIGKNGQRPEIPIGIRRLLLWNPNEEINADGQEQPDYRKSAQPTETAKDFAHSPRIHRDIRTAPILRNAFWSISDSSFDLRVGNGVDLISLWQRGDVDGEAGLR